jgi:hypothetical protein
LDGGKDACSRNLFRISRTKYGIVLCEVDFPDISALSTVQVTPAIGRVTSPTCNSDPSRMSA